MRRLLSRTMLAGLCVAVAGVSGCATSASGARDKSGSIGPLALGQISTTGRGEALTASLKGGLLADLGDVSLTGDERRLAVNAEYKALEYSKAGETVTWQDPDGGDRGEVVPGQPYRVGSQDCRQYSHTVYVGGQPHMARGSACRNEDGSWTRLT